MASYLFFPILYILAGITGFFARVFGQQNQNPFTLREEILTMLQMPAQGGDIQSGEKDMIRCIFDFSETTANEVMIPFMDVTAIDYEITCGDALRMAKISGHKYYNRWDCV